MKTKQELLDELKLELLEIGGVDNWQSYGDAIQEFKEENGFGDDEYLNSKDTLVALESGGVDNWQGYGESLEYFYDYSEYLDTVSEEDFLAGYYQDFDDFLNFKYINKHIAEALKQFQRNQVLLKNN